MTAPAAASVIPRRRMPSGARGGVLAHGEPISGYDVSATPHGSVPSMLAPRLVGYADAARYLGIPIGTLRSMVCRKQIPHVRLAPRVVRFELAALDAVIEERRVEAERRDGAGGAS